MINIPALADAVRNHGKIARIVIADSKGSTPREKGASMLVWDEGSQGSIGGGRLEFHAMAHAMDLLRNGSGSDIRRQSLGPALGQCCGGSVTLVTEIWEDLLCRKVTAAMPPKPGGVFARRIEGSAAMPDRVTRRAAAMADQTPKPAVELIDGWLLEPIENHRQPVFIYGAGHVGGALARILAPLPHVDVMVADMRERLVRELPDGMLRSLGRRPQEVMASAPPDAAHLIMTHEHELDLELCHLVLGRPFTYAGLIGSATKWARFRKRLRSLGHSEMNIDRIESPIGNPKFGKHPQAIAIGTAARLMNGLQASSGWGTAA